MTIHTTPRHRTVGVVTAAAVAVLVAVSCGGSDTAVAPPITEPDPAGATATTAAPAVTQPAADLETTTTGAPESTVDAPEVETVPEPEQPCPEGEHRHTAGEACHPDDDHEPAPDDGETPPIEVICGDGLVLMEEFVTDTDNGCRPETCEGDRTEEGQCALVERELTQDEVAALEAATEDEGADLHDDGPAQLTWDEYGLEGCTEISPGTCDLDGVLYCHDTNTGWAECPGQPSGDACQHDETDPLSLSGSVQTTGQIPEVTLAAGLYRVDVCLANNDIFAGSPDSFLVYFEPVVNEDNIITGGALLTPGDLSKVGGLVVDEQSVVAGTWSRVIEVVWLADPEPFKVAVTPVGHGTWVLRFVPLS